MRAKVACARKYLGLCIVAVRPLQPSMRLISAEDVASGAETTSRLPRNCLVASGSRTPLAQIESTSGCYRLGPEFAAGFGHDVDSKREGGILLVRQYSIAYPRGLIMASRTCHRTAAADKMSLERLFARSKQKPKPVAKPACCSANNRLVGEAYNCCGDFNLGASKRGLGLGLNRRVLLPTNPTRSHPTPRNPA